MPANIRDLWLRLHATDLADRVLSKFKRDVKEAGNAARFAQLQADRATQQGILTQLRMENAVRRTEIAKLANEKASFRNRIEDEKGVKGLEAHVASLRRNVIAHQQLIIAKRDDIIESQKQANVARQNIIDIDKQVEAFGDFGRKLSNNRKINDEADKFNKSFLRRMFTPDRALLRSLITGVPAQLATPVGAAALILGAVFALSFVGAVLSSGALLLLAGGIIGLGALFLRANAEIKAAWTQTVDFFNTSLAKVAEPLITHFIGALEIIRTGAKERVLPVLAQIISSTRHLVETLAVQVVGAVQAFLKPLARPEALAGLQSFIIGIGPSIVKLGKIAGEFFANIAKHGEVVAEAFSIAVSVIEQLVNIVEFFILAFTGALIGLAKLWNFVWGEIKNKIHEIADTFGAFAGVIVIVSDLLKKNADNTKDLNDEFKVTDPEVQKIIDSFMNLTTRGNVLAATTAEVTQKFDALTSKAKSLFSQFMSVDQATAAATTAILGLKDALDKEGRTLDVNTIAGAKNRTSILGAVESAEKLRAAMIENNISVSRANSVFQENIDKIYAQAKAAGIDTSALDSLLDKYRHLADMPDLTKNINIKVAMSGTDQAFKVLGSKFVAFRHGGPTPVNQPFWVGENGPELWWSKKPGFITSNRESERIAGREAGKEKDRVVVYQYITVPPDMDTRMLASELGWQLKGRLG